MNETNHIESVILPIRLLIRSCKGQLSLYERRLLKCALLQIALNLDTNDPPTLSSATEAAEFERFDRNDIRIEAPTGLFRILEAICLKTGYLIMYCDDTLLLRKKVDCR